MIRDALWRLEFEIAHRPRGGRWRRQVLEAITVDSKPWDLREGDRILIDWGHDNGLALYLSGPIAEPTTLIMKRTAVGLSTWLLPPEAREGGVEITVPGAAGVLRFDIATFARGEAQLRRLWRKPGFRWRTPAPEVAGYERI